MLVACSGGADSVALAAGLAAVAREQPAHGLRLVLGHVDHGLRAESAAEARAVGLLAQSLGLRFALVRLDGAALLRDSKAQGLEAAARRARYAALLSLATEHGCALVATGHTRRDQAETVLLRLSRGGGLGALAGVRRQRKLDARSAVSLVRPLLEVGREDTEALCVALGLPFTQDPHNRDPRFGRARVREAFRLLDSLLGPRLEEALARAAAVASAEDALLESLALEAAARARGPEGALRAKALQAMPLALLRRVLATVAAQAGLRPGFAQLERLRALLARPARPDRPDAALSLPGGEALLEAGRLRFVARSGRAPALPVLEPVAVPGPGRYLFGGMHLEVSSAPGPSSVPVDAGLAPLPWTLRCAAPGDRFRPANGRQKKVSDLWIDAKLPRALRPRLALLCDSAGTPFFVEGLRPGAACRNAEEAALHLTWSRKDAR